MAGETGVFLSTQSGEACGERQSHPFPPESLSLGLRMLPRAGLKGRRSQGRAPCVPE